MAHQRLSPGAGRPGSRVDHDPSRVGAARDVLVIQDLAGAVVAELERNALTREHETAVLRLDLAVDAAGVVSWDRDLITGEL